MNLIPFRYKVSLGMATLVMAVTSSCSTIIPLLLGNMVDGLQQGTTTHEPPQTLYMLAARSLGLIGCAFLFREGLNVLRRYHVENCCTRINREMSVKLIHHLLRVSLPTLAQDKVGALHSRSLRSVDGVVRFLRLSFLDFVPALCTGLFAISAALWKHPLLALAMMGVVPSALFLTVRQLMSQKGVRLKLMRASEEIDGTIIEQFGGVEYIRAAHTEDIEISRLDRAMRQRRSKEIRHHFQMSLYGCAKAVNEGFFHILVLACAVYFAINGTVSFGDVLTFSMLFANVMAPLNEVHRVIDEGHESSLRVRDLLEMLKQPLDPSFVTYETRQPQLKPEVPAIVVDDLHVQYTLPDGQHRTALHGISLNIRRGETIGVAGRSGGGKSTWIKVLLRLTHPSQGEVVFGGVPIDQVSRADIGKLIGYVGQQPFVFAGTIAENISYGVKGATDEDIVRAAIKANLHEEILGMPNGYDTQVGERGRSLSGGQCQRLALARVLLRDTPILILDEATSALDNISERHVQRELGLKHADRTILLVAHRLSTLRDADRILVFDGGRIAEMGTYGELVQKGGVFADLVLSGSGAAAPLVST